MKNFLIMCALAVASVGVFEAKGQTAPGSMTPAPQQDSSIGQFHVVGEVTALDAASNQMTVRTGAGSTVAVNLTSATTYKRAQPGATNLEGATVIALGDIGLGDRVMARGRVAADRQSVPAREVIVMTRADITARNEREREEWQRRGIAGTVTAIDPASKAITLTVRGRGGEAVTIDAASASVRFRRYAPDSIRFSDARASRFEDLQMGDQLRALGERSADGARFTPEEIISGSFRTVIGTIVSVNPQTNEVSVTPFGATGAQPLTVRVNADSLVRRIPAEIAQMMTARRAGNTEGARGGAGESASPSQRQNATRPPAGGANNTGSAPPQRMGMGGGGGGGDLRQMLERLPALPLTELQPGALVLVSTTSGDDQSRGTALALVSGIEAFIPMMQPGAGRNAPGASANPGLPGGVLDIGIGLP